MSKKVFVFLFITLTLVGCMQSIKKTDIDKLNGYWEIEKVVFDSGEDKEYTINDTFDYFKIDKAGVGFRKKVMPQLDGTFVVNDTYEEVKVRFKKDKVFLDYVTFYAKWSEEIVKLTEQELVVKNKDNKEYHYKKTKKIDLLHDGEETK